MITLVIEDKPISVNHMYLQSRQGRRFLSKAGREYKKVVYNLAKAEHIDMIIGDLEMEVTYFFGDKRRRDVTNYDKALLDAMTGVVYKDDCQITKITLKKFIDKEYPRTEVCIINKENSMAKIGKPNKVKIVDGHRTDRPKTISIKEVPEENQVSIDDGIKANIKEKQYIPEESQFIVPDKDEIKIIDKSEDKIDTFSDINKSKSKKKIIRRKKGAYNE